MVYDEMVLLQRMKHPNIVRFHDWFESKVFEPNSISDTIMSIKALYSCLMLYRTNTT